MYGLTQEDLEDIVLGVGWRDGFWEIIGAYVVTTHSMCKDCHSDIARAVPGRRVRSIRDHAQILYDPFRGKGPWTTREDKRLKS